MLANIFYLPFWFHPPEQHPASKRTISLAEDAENNNTRIDVLQENFVVNVTENPILRDPDIVQESRSENGTRQRRKKRKRRRKEKTGRRQPYNESRLKEEWEDYIFKR